MNIYTELTPNPATLKFVVDRMLLTNGTIDFTTAESAEGKSDLAVKLFKYPYVQAIFIGHNFITVTKNGDYTWMDIIPVVKEEIKSFINAGGAVVAPDFMPAPPPVTQHTGSELEERIKQILDEQVRPAVAMDGGDIVFHSIEDGVVKLEMRGSCSGCPSSTVTLKQGIQAVLTRLFPNEVKSVESVFV